MSTPLFSFITCTYQSERFIRRCHASLAAQTIGDWEWVVVDDASTDATGETIAALDDPRIRYFRLDANEGRGRARQHALDRARGAYCAIIDMDDFCFPDRLARAHEAMKAGYDFFCSPVALIDASYRVTGIREIGRTGYPRAFIHATLCGRTELIRSIGYAPFRVAEDQQMILRVANELRGSYDDEPLYAYHEDASTGVKGAVAGKYFTIRSLIGLVRRGTLRPSPSVLRLIGYNAGSMAALLPFLAWPPAYLWTLRFRSGKTTAAVALSETRAAFVREMSNRFPLAPAR